MFCRRLINQFSHLVPSKEIVVNNRRLLHCTIQNCQKSRSKEVSLLGTFETAEQKNKETYLDLIRIYVNNNQVHRRGHVEFIYAALKNMEPFGVHKDLEVYKALTDVLPKGKFIPENIFQSEFMHYPKQQQCIVDLLEQMEDNAVMPDQEMEDMLLNIFGNRGFPLRKFWRMMYWMPKFKNLSPWPLPEKLPDDTFELAKLAIARIASVDPQAKVTVYETAHIPDSVDETWIVSMQSPAQKELLKKHKVDVPIYVEGSFRIWIKDRAVNYFILRANRVNTFDDVVPDTDDVSKISFSSVNFSLPSTKQLDIIPTVHEQEDGIIFSVCATGTSSKDSLLSWIRHLELNDNPLLAKIPIVFTLKSGTKEVTKVDPEDKTLQEK